MAKYQNYIKSREWYSKHKAWLKEADYRCQFLPWITVGKKVNGKYHPYQTHHLHYGNLGNEELGRDVVVLCPVAHQLIYHCLLSGGVRRAGQQKTFPNCAQRVANLWCSLPLQLKMGLIYLFLAIAVIIFIPVLWDLIIETLRS